jgi:hypothetical protein
VLHAIWASAWLVEEIAPALHHCVAAEGHVKAGGAAPPFVLPDAHAYGVHTSHCPELHAFPPGHTLPHAPQLLTSVWRSISQPFVFLPSQLAYPLWQAMLQVPAAHTDVLLASEGHAVAQVPQFVGSSCVLVQVPLQLVSPDWQLTVQSPALQTSPAAHALWHAPQLLRSVCRLSQVPLQLVSPA